MDYCKCVYKCIRVCEPTCVHDHVTMRELKIVLDEPSGRGTNNLARIMANRKAFLLD